jgi:hypothetical protein
MFGRLIIIAPLVAASLAESASAIVTSDVAGSHIVAPGQPSFGLNLDGVANVGGLNPLGGPPVVACSGALISDRHVLCAAHCFDFNADGLLRSPMAPLRDSVIFDLADGLVSIEYELDAVQLPDNWPAQQADVAVITLKRDAPPQIPRYPLYAGSAEVGRFAVVVGYGDTGHGATGEVPTEFGAPPVKRAGLNRIDDIRTDLAGVEFLSLDFDSGLEANNTLAIIGFDSDLGFGADEVALGNLDSGGPMFVGGAVAGVNAFSARLPASDVTSKTDSSWGEAFFATRVSHFRNFLAHATSGTAVFVPEPASNVQVLIGFVLLNRCLAARRNHVPFI